MKTTILTTIALAALCGSSFSQGALKGTTLNLSGNATVGGSVTATSGFVGNVTGNVSGSAGSATGNAATATKLITARNIAGTAFDGTSNINIDAFNLSGSSLATGITDSNLQSFGQLVLGLEFDSDNSVDIGNAADDRPRTVYAGTSIVAPLFQTSTGGVNIRAGSGSPEGVVTANTGALYLRTNGSTGTTLYIKESGTGNTGWANPGGGGTVDANDLTGTTLASGVVTSSLTSVGTLGTGTWQATAIGATYGGTGLDTSASTGFPKLASGMWSIESAATHLTSIGGTTVGKNIFKLTDPGAITFLRMNADNTVDALSASAFRTAIGAGSGTGDIVGPGSSTDNALMQWDGTTGALAKNSTLIYASSRLQLGGLSATPGTFILTGQEGTGSNVNAAAALQITGPRGTGSGTAGTSNGVIEFLTPTSGASSSTLHTLTSRWKINGGSAGSFTIADTTSTTSQMIIGRGSSSTPALSIGGHGFYYVDSSGMGVYVSGSARWQYNTNGFNTISDGSGYIGRDVVQGTYLRPAEIHASSLMGAPKYTARDAASSTDAAGQSVTVGGGLGRSNGAPGAIISTTGLVLTSSGTTLHTAANRGYVYGSEKSLTESTATVVCNVALASSKYVGGELIVTTHADDGTDFQAITEHFTFAAVNKGGTVTATIQATPSTSTTAASAGTLTTTWTAVANGNGVDIKNSAVSSLTQTTLKCQWQLRLNGDGTAAVTP